MAERKVSKPRVQRLWTLVFTSRSDAQFVAGCMANRHLFRVEVREVKPRKSGKGKRRGK